MCSRLCSIMRKRKIVRERERETEREEREDAGSSEIYLTR